MFGYVEHSYSRKNPWAKLGNLFIGLGPLFSGLGIIVLMLWICMPAAWNGYLEASHTLLATESISFGELFKGIFVLFSKIPSAFASNWWRALIGIVIILPVSLHVKLSLQDIKGSLGAFPIYAVLLAVFSLVTFVMQWHTPIVNAMTLFNFRMLSVFLLIIAFAAVWVVIALLIWLIKKLVSFF